ncbi:MAG: hypothetical protein MK066_12925 [Crocinitomicaceae bacterium]|nr:hypothetical protein [Crocinitomicaceae bacterium]
MRKILFVFLSVLSFTTFGQTPEGINYQAVIRNNSGTIIADSPIGLKISILQTTASGISVYEESFATVTNAFGLVNVVIGQGSVISGSFSTIDWFAGPYFAEVSVDETGGTTYTVLGTQQLMSVPYALHAKTANSVLNDQVNDADSDPLNEIQDISLTGSDLSITDGSTVVLTDADSLNEIQFLSINDVYISLSNGGGSIEQAAPVKENTGGRSDMCSGNSVAGTAWQVYDASTIYLNVNTSGCGFLTTPRYFTSIGGVGSHFELVGFASIYSPTPTGFTVYIKKNDGSTLSPVDAANGGWFINWTAVGE